MAFTHNGGRDRYAFPREPARGEGRKHGVPERTKPNTVAALLINSQNRVACGARQPTVAPRITPIHNTHTPTSPNIGNKPPN